jgi:hypothetical protein
MAHLRIFSFLKASLTISPVGAEVIPHAGGSSNPENDIQLELCMLVAQINL